MFILLSILLFLNTTGLYVSLRKEHVFESVYKRTEDLYNPRSLKQKQYVDVLNNNIKPVIIVTGPAGTGKTLFSCLKSIDMLMMGQITKIVIT